MKKEEKRHLVRWCNVDTVVVLTSDGKRHTFYPISIEKFHLVQGGDLWVCSKTSFVKDDRATFVKIFGFDENVTSEENQTCTHEIMIPNSNSPGRTVMIRWSGPAKNSNEVITGFVL
ncbi:MAG: hypothetical protein WC663_00530 [Patescibacteria group bacterium]|jgi:hypothetical protein